MIKTQQFFDLAPSIVSQIIDFFAKRGLELTVVGGVPRDYLLSGKIGRDWDVEISGQDLAFSVSFWKELARDLKVLGKVSNLSYQVIRLQVGDCEFEFSPPRTEVFNHELHHHNFEAKFDFKLDPSESWKRRDFTVNAIGFKLAPNDLQVIDPFAGQEMLQQKILHPCSENFKRDPVRYLRAYRFSQKLGFTFSPLLSEYLGEMTHDFSSHYLLSEMKKSHAPLKFYQCLIKANCQTLPLTDERILRHDFGLSLVDEFNLYAWVLSLEINSISSAEFSQYFNLASSITKKVISFSSLSRELAKIDVSFLKQEFAVVCHSSELHTVFSWYYAALQLASRSETAFTTEFSKKTLDDWCFLLQFEPLKDVKHIDPPLRAKYIVWNLCQRI